MLRHVMLCPVRSRPVLSGPVPSVGMMADELEGKMGKIGTGQGRGAGDARRVVTSTDLRGTVRVRVLYSEMSKYCNSTQTTLLTFNIPPIVRVQQRICS